MKKQRTSLILNKVIADVVKKYENKKITFSIEENFEINIRPNSIKRCLINLTDNGLSYGQESSNCFRKKNIR